VRRERWTHGVPPCSARKPGAQRRRAGPRLSLRRPWVTLTDAAALDRLREPRRGQKQTARRAAKRVRDREMLGSAADADDVVQETWLRWVDAYRAAVRDPRAILVRIVSRQALNRLRTLSRRHEEYVGEWLPEPLLTSPDVAEDVELAEGVSIAMLIVLETLGPAERRVFVLRRALRRDLGGRGQVLRSGQADRAPGARTRGRAAAADRGRPHRAAAGRRAVPRRPHHG
jgi:RNA polymerase sigma factor (sigma-70 family)